MRGALAILVVFILALPRAEAQEGAIVLVENGAPPARVQAWRARLERRAGTLTTLAEWADGLAPIDTVDADRLAALAEIEALLVSARQAALRLEERDALRDLARAEALALRHLSVPGMAAWYAEIELATAITAWQAGTVELADAALRRAASVDPARTVQAAEAPPELVERSREIARAALTGPRGRFEVRAGVPRAHAFLDDRALGALPVTVETNVGPHVLRVEAPGHRSWAQVIEVLEGERPPVRVSLAPTRVRAAARRAEQAARAGDVAEVDSALAALRSFHPPPVWVAWVGSGVLDRAVLVRCDAQGCEAPRRLEPGALGPVGDASVAEALDWLVRGPALGRGAADEPWWERWYVWAGAGAVLAAGITAALLLAQQQEQGPLRVIVDAGQLPAR